MVIPYVLPTEWIRYDVGAVAPALVEAKSAVLALQQVPYRREWVDRLQRLQLRREVAGTSRIEGADFTERELDVALRETPERLTTRSQRQVAAALRTYNWIAKIPADRPIDEDLVGEIHRWIVTGADDDHCPPGRLREKDQNVSFGQPRHRGVEGGEPCRQAFAALCSAIQREFRGHDPLVQALAAHYHLAAMHPFLDGNGRASRAIEALLLQRAGLRDACFVAMSNYYYDEKPRYLSTLAGVRESNHDLTPFLVFALRGIAAQSQKLLAEIRREISKDLFLNLMLGLFHRLKSKRKRAIANRQVEILKLLLETDQPVELEQIATLTAATYAVLKNPRKALVRDLNDLIELKAIAFERRPILEPPPRPGGPARFEHWLGVRLEWPTEITETELFRRLQALPKAKTHSFLR